MKPDFEFIEKVITPYNPWWADASYKAPEQFKRPIFKKIISDLHDIKQVLSITGPRRVGKTTLIRQIVQSLIEAGVDPKRIIYFSLDEPLLFQSQYKDHFFDHMMEWIESSRGKGKYFLFLDEVQRFERWELFIKKYYDLGFPARFVISGSASSPIFKKSRESLMGRVKDYHLFPFSFREFVLFKKQSDADFIKWIELVGKIGQEFLETFVIDWRIHENEEGQLGLTKEKYEELKGLLDFYLVEGGFPEVWEFKDFVQKQQYLFDNQVQKVIFEDLVLAAEFRKPENIKQFYLSLIEQPGQELNLLKISERLGVSRPMLEKYFPLLEMTDLVKRVPRFSKKPLRVRRGSVKCYLVDLALRNAVMKLSNELLQNPTMLGYYAENLVFNTIRSWGGLLDISYYKDGSREVDFVATFGGKKFLPIEVKYKEDTGGLEGLRFFLDRHQQSFGFLVTKNPLVNGIFPKDERIYPIALPVFLALFG